MSVVRRTRSLARRGITVQRRVALAQLLFWPAVLGIGVAAGAAVVLRRRRAAHVVPQQRLPPPSVNG